jgi:thioredoxin reductase
MPGRRARRSADAVPRSTDGVARPFPPGDYPLLVVGSGPGGLQVSQALREQGIEHAVLSADPAPGGMFRRWPFFQRLLSWTKPYAPVERESRAYERYDWNSLLSADPAARALQAGLMDGSSYFPSRAEMEANLSAFADRSGVQVRYDCHWQATRREEGPDGERFVIVTSDGEYRARVLVLAVGVAEPLAPPFPGGDLVPHYAQVRPTESYAGKSVFIVGKQNSGFELATGLLAWARRIILASPSPTTLSVDTRSLVGVRARYVQPYEDHVLGGGVLILDAAIEGIERAGQGWRVRTRPSAGTGSGKPPSSQTFEVDEVITATGFRCPLLDLPALGVVTFGQSELPAQTAYWESPTVPGIHFAGTITQGARGLRKHGLPSNSGAVHGARYNARVLAEHLGRTRFGIEPARPTIAPGDLVDRILAELSEGPEIFHQRSYLAWMVDRDARRGLLELGIQPLTWFLDDGPRDGLAVTLEADGSGAIYPVLYVRQASRVEEHLLEPDPMGDYRSSSYRKAVTQLTTALRG